MFYLEQTHAAMLIVLDYRDYEESEVSQKSGTWRKISAKRNANAP